MEISDLDLFDAKSALDYLEKNRNVASTNWTESGLGLKILTRPAAGFGGDSAPSLPHRHQIRLGQRKATAEGYR